MATFSNSNLLPTNLTLDSFIQSQQTVNLSSVTNQITLAQDLIQEVVSSRPILITKDKLETLSENIALVSFDPLADSGGLNNKSFSIRFLNWVEPAIVSGFTKTAFFTEVNTGLKVGDRVFIIGGNYCSDALIQTDKYKTGRDGYKILQISDCRVVLDIDYNGILPWNEVDDDQFIKVYYIRNRKEFIQANRQISTRGDFSYKFGNFQNNIAYIDTPQSAISGWGKTLGAFSTPGFLIKNDNLNSTWISIPFESGSFSTALSPTYSNNERVKIMNGSFTHNGKEYREGYVYKWSVGPTQSEWIVDVSYLRPILTKTNFRGGNFKGTWNTGLYGKQNSKIVWHGTGTWNGGTLLNTEWLSGNIDSKFSLSQSFVAEFDTLNQPRQKVNLPDNDGSGFNYIIDSQILSSNLVTRGNIYNSTLGTFSIVNSVVENHVLSATESYSVRVRDAKINESTCNNSLVELSDFINSKAVNSKVKSSIITNSAIFDSAVVDSSVTSDDVIKIEGYDELVMSETTLPGSSTFSQILGPSQKVYKFYINENSYKKIKNLESFYIRGLVFVDDDKRTLDFFDRKFRLTSWTEWFDAYSDPLEITNLPSGIVAHQFYKRGVEHTAWLSTREENDKLFTSVTDGSNYFTTTTGQNPKKNYSIDIVMNILDIVGNTFSGINFNRSSATSSSANPQLPPIVESLVDITGAYIIDSSFESGLIENSDWNSGIHIEPNRDNLLTLNSLVGGELNLQALTQSGLLSATLSIQNGFEETEGFLYQGKIAFLRAVDWVIEGIVTGVTISTPGSAYSSGSGVGTTGSVTGVGLTLDIIAQAPTGLVTSAQVSNGGTGYAVGESLTIDSGGINSTVVVTSVTNSVTRIPDTWKILGLSGSNALLQEITSSTQSVIQTLQTGGRFKTDGALNRWGYLHGVKFNRVKIKSGLLRRPYLLGSLISTEKFNSRDIDYADLSRVKKLIISDAIFSNTSNILSDATYTRSHFVGVGDTFNNGIVEKSVWNGMEFNLGTIKHSRWVSGKFNSGIFYNSRTFDGTSSINTPFYYNEGIKNYYKDGLTTATISNDRWSWQSGDFGGKFTPEFFKSDWESGDFKSGKFYFSKFYGGSFSSGSIGDRSLTSAETRVYSGDFINPTVINAQFISSDTSFYQNTPQTINWLGGRFDDGVFASDFNQGQNVATWYSGDFNGGAFQSMAKWKSGNFNGGKFTSAFGWTNSNSASQSEYGWESGKFNDGEFGNANGMTNSTWYTGEFNSGVFRGRVWNDGLFKSGIFEGSATTSAIGGTESSGALVFVDGFSSSYFGLWRSGWVTEVKDKFVTEEKIFTKARRAIQEEFEIVQTRAIIRNALWQSGTFSHQSGEMINSVWLDGRFQAGRMINSSFNPYVTRNGSPTQSFNLSDTCLWENGQFNGGDFYISKWEKGTFELGNAWGMIWKNGTVLYMNAFNVFWEDGLWRNGNWYGSSFEFGGSISSDFEKQILFRGMSWSGTASAHYWNIFEVVDPKSKFFYTANAATPVIDTNLDPTNISPNPPNPPPPPQ